MSPRRSPRLAALARIHGNGPVNRQDATHLVTPSSTASSTRAATPSRNAQAGASRQASRTSPGRRNAPPQGQGPSQGTGTAGQGGYPLVQRGGPGRGRGPRERSPSIHGDRDEEEAELNVPPPTSSISYATAPGVFSQSASLLTFSDRSMPDRHSGAAAFAAQASFPSVAARSPMTSRAAWTSSGVFQFPDMLPDMPTPSADAPIPSPTTSEIGLLPPGGKPSRKNITAEAFSGSVAPGHFDSGVRRWWRTFTNQLSDAQILDGHRWLDVQCRNLFAASLAGDAADWYADLRATRSYLSFQLVGELLVEKYKPKIPEPELMNRIMHEQKRRQETYQEYSQRLPNMVDSLPGGAAVESNARQAMHTFIKRAYAKYSDELKSYVARLQPTMPAARILQLLVDHLAYMAESDGRFTLPPAHNMDPPSRSSKRSKVEGVPPVGRSGTGLAVVVEHKHKKSFRANNSRRERKESSRDADRPSATPDTRCYNCQELGHFARDCPEKKNHDGTAARLRGSAAAALNEESA